MEKMTIKQLKKGDFFTLKPLDNPKESQVWIKGEYDRTDKGYVCIAFSDICKSRILKSGKEIYTDFIF